MAKRCKPPASKIFELDLTNSHVTQAAKFLCKFGYLDPKAMEEQEALGESLRLYQRFYQLVPTGDLTLETIKHMRRPRCGNPDPVQPLITDGTAKADPIVYFGGRWDHLNITYFIDNFTSDMTGEAGVVQDAFDVWADVTPLSFTRIFDTNAADINISWETFNHGDGNAFDGVGDVLAHANSPGAGTFVHFDDSETWGTTGSGNTDLQSVAIHEIGHALGLGHSREDDAIMFASYDGVKRDLHELDIKGIRSRYPEIANFGDARAARVSLWGLKNSGGSHVTRVRFSETRPRVAWVQRTMADPLTDFDRDNAWTAEIIEVDENRIDTRVFGGDHWGSEGSPNNVHQGAFAGTFRSVTFRVSGTHTADLDVFGVGCVMSL